MKIINNIKDKFSYHFIVGAVAASLLCSVGSYGAEITDAELEGRIAKRYAIFKGNPIVGAVQPVCLPLQFVWHLANSNIKDPESQRMIGRILSSGLGVGGIDTNRSANEAETGVYYSLLGMFKAQDVSQYTFRPTTYDTTTVLGRHQLALAIAHEFINVPVTTTAGAAQPFVNYVTNKTAYTALNKSVQGVLTLKIDKDSLMEVHRIAVKSELSSPTLNLSKAAKEGILDYMPSSIEGREQLIRQVAAIINSAPNGEGLQLVEEIIQIKGFGNCISYLSLFSRLSNHAERKLLMQYLRDVIGDSWLGSYDGFVDGLLHVRVDSIIRIAEQVVKLLKTTTSFGMAGVLAKIIDETPDEEQSKSFDSLMALLNRSATNCHFTIIKDLCEVSAKIRHHVAEQAARIVLPIVESHCFSYLIGILTIENDASRQSIADQILRLLRLPLYRNNITGILGSIHRVNVNYREAFITFIINNNINDLNTILELSLIPIADWGTTLVRIREREAGAERVRERAIVPMHNQTVHDTAYEESIKLSLEGLAKCYEHKAKIDKGTLLALFLSKVEFLQTQEYTLKKEAIKFISAGEAHVAQYFFTKLHAQESVDPRIIQALTLSWYALNDTETAASMKLSTSEQEVNLRFASWVRQGPIDSQLAYIFDNIDAHQGRFQSKAELYKAVEENPHILKDLGGASCDGGTANRLIDGLNGVHPGVIIKPGEGTLANYNAEARRQFLTKTIAEFVSNVAEASHTDFGDKEKLKRDCKAHLEEFVREEQAKADSSFARYNPSEIDDVIEHSLEQAVINSTNLKPITEYLQITESHGLEPDLKAWADAQAFSLESHAKVFETKAKELIEDKLTKINPAPLAIYVNPLKEEARTLAVRLATRLQYQRWGAVAEQVLKEFKGKAESTKTLFDLIKNALIAKGVSEGSIQPGQLQAIVNDDVELKDLFASKIED